MDEQSKISLGDEDVRNEDVYTTRVVSIAQAVQSSRGESDPVENLFSTPVPEELWHYTTVGGLQGILSSGRVWATEARYTTDKTEFVHARDIVLEYLNAIAPTNKAEEIAKKSGLQIIDEEYGTGALSKERAEVFIASFSSAKDLKSQWEGYSAGGTGVSIAFDLRNIRPPKESGYAVTLAPCIYEKAESEKLLKTALGHYMETTIRLYHESASRRAVAQKLRDWHLVDRIFSQDFDRAAFEKAMDENTTEELRVALTLTKFDLLRLASHCKNRYFQEEREWRLALPHTKGKPLSLMTVEYRGPEHAIPYVAHNLFSQGLLPITQVMTGPLAKDKAAIEKALKTHGYNVPVVPSESPMRTIDQIGTKLLSGE